MLAWNDLMLLLLLLLLLLSLSLSLPTPPPSLPSFSLFFFFFFSFPIQTRYGWLLIIIIIIIKCNINLYSFTQFQSVNSVKCLRPHHVIMCACVCVRLWVTLSRTCKIPSVSDVALVGSQHFLSPPLYVRTDGLYRRTVSDFLSVSEAKPAKPAS